jgi:hypothetical protein
MSTRCHTNELAGALERADKALKAENGSANDSSKVNRDTQS